MQRARKQDVPHKLEKARCKEIGNTEIEDYLRSKPENEN